MQTIVTIARQFGSGGHEVGQAFATRMSVPFYDKELIEMAREKSGLDPEMLASADEKAGSSLLYTLATGGLMMNNRFTLPNCPINDQLFFLQSESIRRIAEKGTCVIVGRCADYVLRDTPHVARVFLHAPLETRIERIARLHKLSRTEAEATIQRVDKQRATYSNFYTDRKWGRATDYDLVINTQSVGVEGAVEMLEAFVHVLEQARRTAHA